MRSATGGRDDILDGKGPWGVKSSSGAITTGSHYPQPIFRMNNAKCCGSIREPDA
jgi:hypothetical protein